MADPRLRQRETGEPAAERRGAESPRLTSGCLLILLVLLLLPAVPWLVWHARAASPRTVQVVDYTVPHTDYREHRALFWVLDHAKAMGEEGDRSWDPAADYVGYRPGRVDVHPAQRGERLGPEHLRWSDLLFVVDTYGVYTGDYLQPGMRTALDRTRLIFGGLGPAEVDPISSFVEAGGALVAEFNTFASPTTGASRERLSALLGMRWTGWAGRYFADLSDMREVPAWAPREWEAQRRQPWDFEGPGYLLVHEDATLAVLVQGEHVEPRGLRIVGPRRDDPLMDGVAADVPFRYWFDVVEPLAGTEVLARYRLHVTEAGGGILAEHGLEPSFPAVLRASREPLRVYFAGDFSDSSGVLGPHNLAGWAGLRSVLAGLRGGPGPGQFAFTWRFYVPLVRNILETPPTRASQTSPTAG